MIHPITTLKSNIDGYAALGKLSKVSKDLFLDELCLDFSGCTFFEANLAAPLATILDRASNAGNNIKFIHISNQIEKILRKNGFLLKYGFPEICDTNQTTVKFLHVDLAEEGKFAEHLDLNLKGRGLPKMTQQLRKSFIQSIFEVFQNAVTHSESKSGFYACGQYYPNLHRLDFTMADGGVGIRTKVRHHLGKDISSIDAIRWALQEGNTTKSGQRPGGLGLKFLKEFIELNNGTIQLISRMGCYQFCNGKEYFEKMQHDFLGTVVNLEINTNDNKSYRLKSEVPLDSIF